MHHFLCTRQEARRPRRARRCLLKGCERWFTPTHPQCRYCSATCQEAARRWRRAKASQRYRASVHGRQRRRAQQKRYRQRRQAQAAATLPQSPPTREGQRPACRHEDFSPRMCDRPGCYALFWVLRRQLCQRFCSLACRLALRRVLDREERFRQRRRRRRRRRVSRRRSRPDSS